MANTHRISLGIMAHDEAAELRQLLSVVAPYRSLFCEIVIVDDFSQPEMDEIFRSHHLTVYKRKLVGNFAAQRNFLLSKLTGDTAFILDPDECPGDLLLRELPKIAATMALQEIDIVSIPRLNIHYDADTLPALQSVHVDQKMLDAQAPDRQTRIIRLAKHLRYINKVHERIVGARTVGMLPNRIEYAIIHTKSRKRQAAQNQLYKKIGIFAPNEIGKRLGLKRLAKRLGLLGNFKEVELYGLT